MERNAVVYLFAVLLLVFFVPSCSSDSDDNPANGGDGETSDQESLPPLGDEIFATTADETISLDILTEDVAVAWDANGIPHIYASNIKDMGIATGYIHAGHRMVQMEFLRKLSTGRLTDLAGAVAIDTDIQYRKLFSLRDGGDLFQAIWDELEQESKDLIQAYVDGINARLAQYRADGSDWPEPFNFLLVNQSPQETDDWEWRDVIAFSRYQMWSLSSTLWEELDHTTLKEALSDDLFADMMNAKPTTGPSVLPKASGAQWNNTVGTRRGMAFAEAVKDFSRQLESMQQWSYFKDRNASNNWTTKRNSNGINYVCNDPHLELGTPAVWYPMSFDTRSIEGDPNGYQVAGVVFPATPLVAIGRNDKIAWGATVTNYDVTDIYLEEVTMDGDTPKSVTFNGAQVDVNCITHQFRKGHLQPFEYDEVDLCFVPHHGPLFQGEDASGNSFWYSVRWTGMDPSREIETFAGFARAQNLDELFEAAKDYATGAQNFVFGTVDGEFGYYPHAAVPIRKGDLTANPPWMILPGTGEYEWDGYIPDEDLPQLKNPDQGYVVTANNYINPFSLDGDPLSGDYYYQFSATDGWRAYSSDKGVSELVGSDDYTWENMRDLQFNQISDYSAYLLPMILGIVDENAIEANMSDDAKAGLGLLRDWSFHAAMGLTDYKDPASGAVSDADEVLDSAATTFFNHLILRLGNRIFVDELEDAGAGSPVMGRRWLSEIIRELAEDDVTSPWFDDVSTAATAETPADIFLSAFDMAAEDILAREEFSGGTIADALWGRVHNQVLTHPLNAMTDEYNQGPFAAGGDGECINVASFGANFVEPEKEDYNFSNGPSMRMVNEITEDGIVTYLQHPGGVDERPDSDFFLNLHEKYMNNESVVLNASWESVKDAGIAKFTVFQAAGGE